MRSLLRFLPLNLQRRLFLYQTNNNPFSDYLKKNIPARNDEVIQTEFLVLDFETTGLDATKNNILSLGYTVICNNKVQLSRNVYFIIRQENQLSSQNVSIHQITDSDAEQGVSLKHAIDCLLSDLSGKVLVAHHASIEQKFLNAACLKLYGFELPVRIVDTMQLEKKRLERRHSGIKQNQLRLFNIRKAYGLPRYKAHNALEDAVSTAELLLVQISNICGQKNCRVKDL